MFQLSSSHTARSISKFDFVLRHRNFAPHLRHIRISSGASPLGLPPRLVADLFPLAVKGPFLPFFHPVLRILTGLLSSHTVGCIGQ